MMKNRAIYLLTIEKKNVIIIVNIKATKGVTQMDFDSIIRAADARIPPKPRLVLTPVKGKCGIFDTKLGGVPYYPKTLPYPKGTALNYSGLPLRLLVQLNFGQLPSLDGFPKSGILQIFLACENDNLYGFNYHSIKEQNIQNGFRVIYHKDIITDETLLYSNEDVPWDKFSSDEDDFPVHLKEILLKAESPSDCPATPDDFRFAKALTDSYNEVSENKADDFRDIEEKYADMAYARRDEPSAFIGGYPLFEQSDPREFETGFDLYDTVLFELLSITGDRPAKWGGFDYDVIWGDVGTGVFLIPREKLLALDFTDVLYNYDCG